MSDVPRRNLFAIWNWPKPVLILGGALLLIGAMVGGLFWSYMLFGVQMAPAPVPAPTIVAEPVDTGSTTGP